MIGFAAEIGDFVSCNTKQFLLFPIIAVHFTYLVIAVDKVIGITFPFKYKGMMTPYLVASMVVIPWLLAVLFSAKTPFNVNQYVKNAKFGLCISTGSAFIELFLTHIIAHDNSITTCNGFQHLLDHQSLSGAQAN